MSRMKERLVKDQRETRRGWSKGGRQAILPAKGLSAYPGLSGEMVELPRPRKGTDRVDGEQAEDGKRHVR